MTRTVFTVSGILLALAATGPVVAQAATGTVGQTTTPAEEAGASAEDIGDDKMTVVWPEKHAFKGCFRTRFTMLTKGRTKGKPSNWVSDFHVISSLPTTETYVFCFPEAGVKGSAMYTGASWIYFERNAYGELHGDVKGRDGKVTRFIYVPNLDEHWNPGEGPATLYIALDADHRPAKDGPPNILFLQGVARRIAVGGR